MSNARFPEPSPRPGCDDSAFAATLSALAIALLAFAGSAFAAGPEARLPAAEPALAAAPTAAATAPSITGSHRGGFTGRYADGVPIYRLPAVSVTGRRPVDVATPRRDPAPARTWPSSGAAG